MSEKNSNPHGVKVGDIWEDCDRRGWISPTIPRRVRILDVGPVHAKAAEISPATGRTVGRETKIRLNRFKPTSTGYRRIIEGS